MNGRRDRGNRKAIERYGGVPVVAEIEPLPVLDPGTLSSCYRCTFGAADG